MKLFPCFVLFPVLLDLLCLSARAQGPITVYQARGVLSDYDATAAQATIDCDAIPGLMGATRASFVVHDTADFKNLYPGDIVALQLCVSGAMTWIEHASRTGAAPNAQEYRRAHLKKEAKMEAGERHSPEPPVRVASPRLVAGDLVPDIALTDQFGHKIHFRNFKGNAVALTFIYTSCSMLTYCPLMSQKFVRTQDIMPKLGTGDRWQLLSITIDPTHDTPPVLASYASAMRADPAHWTFATAADESKVREFGGGFGLEFEHDDTVITHNLCTAVIDPSGRVYSIYHGNTWTPQMLASDLRASMRKSISAVP